VLSGGAGTLAELALLWAHARAGVLPGPIVLWDEVWARLAAQLAAEGRLEASVVRATRTAETAEDAVRLAMRPLAPAGE
jgi:predicted Rossmann-fold nucleotide-binding protein